MPPSMLLTRGGDAASVQRSAETLHGFGKCVRMINGNEYAIPFIKGMKRMRGGSRTNREAEACGKEDDEE